MTDIETRAQPQHELVLRTLNLELRQSSMPISDTDDPRDVLSRAREFAKQGDFGTALEHFQWFHENALKIRPSLKGVRLSFALKDWLKLAQKHPPAMEALQTTRDRAVKRLFSADGTQSDFKEIAAIDWAQDSESNVCDLYEALASSNANLARQCQWRAFEPLARQKRFLVARKCMWSPRRFVTWEVNQLNARLSDDFAILHPELKVAHTHFFVEKMNLIGEVMKESGERWAANVVIMAGTRRIKYPDVRLAVYVSLYSRFSDHSYWRKSSTNQ
ncbi:MAG: hypothetical protein HC853_01425 [Anaerolineae bacterium]|nr:hypothetical protein [Anaerolineae bacterium]